MPKKKQPPRRKSTKKKPKSKAKHKVKKQKAQNEARDEGKEEEEMVDNEQYFRRKSKARSNATFQVDLISDLELTHMVSAYEEQKGSFKSALFDLYHEEFCQMQAELVNGFNALCYGMGSKKFLLDYFAQNFMDGIVVSVQGYATKMNVRSILQVIAKQLPFAAVVPADVVRGATRIRDMIKESRKRVPRIILVIHNIDGPGFQDDASQQALCILSRIPSICVVASVDHVNAHLLWDFDLMSRFRWFKHELTTYMPYFNEVRGKFEKSKQLVEAGTDRSRGIQHILKSLTPHHLEAMQVIGERQVDDKINGISHHDFFSLCRDLVIAVTMDAFEVLLTELTTHELIVKNADSLYVIPFSEEVIRNEILQTED